MTAVLRRLVQTGTYRRAVCLRRRSACADCGRGGDAAAGLVRARTADAY